MSQTDAPPPAPTALQLFFVCARIGLTSFGGGVSGWFLREFVQRRKWLSQDEFLNGLAVSQALPGINVINLAIWIGNRFCGARGALAGFLGITGPSACVILLLGIVFTRLTEYQIVHIALAGAAAAAIGLSLTIALTTAYQVRRAVFPVAILVATFIGVGFLHLSLPLVVAVLGALSVAVEYWRTR